jgi:hypothetical protein
MRERLRRAHSALGGGGCSVAELLVIRILRTSPKRSSTKFGSDGALVALAKSFKKRRTLLEFIGDSSAYVVMLSSVRIRALARRANPPLSGGAKLSRKEEK